jgi:hypothetical protein
MTMLPPAEVREELTARSFALIKAFLAGDLEALDALVDDDDTELIPMLMEILIGALARLVGVEEIERQVNLVLDERRTRLAG